MTKKRKRFTPAKRAQILAAARSGGLTAKQVKAKYGVSAVTYYLWRRKAGLTGTRGRATGMKFTGTNASSKGLESMLRTAVRQRIQSALPTIVRDEVHSYFNTLLAKAPGRRGRRTA